MRGVARGGLTLTIIEKKRGEVRKWKNEGKTHGGEPVIVDLEALVPEDHLLRKIERVIDYEWLYALLLPYYCHDNGRPGIDPMVLIKMVLIQHLFGIASLRQTYQEILVNNAYAGSLGMGCWNRSRTSQR